MRHYFKNIQHYTFLKTPVQFDNQWLIFVSYRVTLGNQVDGVKLVDPDIVRAFKKVYPDGNCMKPAPKWWLNSCIRCIDGFDDWPWRCYLLRLFIFLGHHVSFLGIYTKPAAVSASWCSVGVIMTVANACMGLRANVVSTTAAVLS